MNKQRKKLQKQCSVKIRAHENSFDIYNDPLGNTMKKITWKFQQNLTKEPVAIDLLTREKTKDRTKCHYVQRLGIRCTVVGIQMIEESRSYQRHTTKPQILCRAPLSIIAETSTRDGLCKFHSGTFLCYASRISASATTFQRFASEVQKQCGPEACLASTRQLYLGPVRDNLVQYFQRIGRAQSSLQFTPSIL